MPINEFTLPQLKVVLMEGAGVEEDVDLEGDIADTPFEELGYESLALLETGSRIEREYGIRLDEEALTDARTPRQLVELVNAHLSGAPTPRNH